MITKTAIAVAFMAGAIPLAHQALDRATRTETLATQMIAAAKASAAGTPGAGARVRDLQAQARALAGADVPQAQPATVWVPVDQYPRERAQ